MAGASACGPGVLTPASSSPLVSQTRPTPPHCRHRGIHRRSVKTMAKRDCLEGAEAAAWSAARSARGENEPASAASLSREEWLERLSSDEQGCAIWEAWSRLKPSRRLILLREI